MIQGFSAPCLASSIHFIIAVDICVRSLFFDGHVVARD